MSLAPFQLDLCVLASGSSGNCSVVRSPGGLILIDGGLGPRLLHRRLTALGLNLDDVTAVCLTHLDRDHCTPNFLAWAARRRVAIHCCERKASWLYEIARREGHATPNLQPFGDDPFEPVAGLWVEPFSLAHDQEGSHGFVVTNDDSRIGFATDLGRVPMELLERFTPRGGLDVLAIESNYCPRLQATSNRPEFLKRRIMGGRGHLSNEQAYSAVKQVLDRHAAAGWPLPGRIALLHRSRQCNCPDRVRTLFSQDKRISPRLVLAEQHEPTGWLRRGRDEVARQMEFAW